MIEKSKDILHAALIHYGLEGPRNVFTKRDVMAFANDDLGAIEFAFEEWEKAGAIHQLADIRAVTPDTPVVQIVFASLRSLLKGY